MNLNFNWSFLIDPVVVFPHRGTAAIGPLVKALKAGESITFEGREVLYEDGTIQSAALKLHQYLLTVSLLSRRSGLSRSVLPLIQDQCLLSSSVRLRSLCNLSAPIDTWEGKTDQNYEFYILITHCFFIELKWASVKSFSSEFHLLQIPNRRDGGSCSARGPHDSRVCSEHRSVQTVDGEVWSQTPQRLLLFFFFVFFSWHTDRLRVSSVFLQVSIHDRTPDPQPASLHSPQRQKSQDSDAAEHDSPWDLSTAPLVQDQGNTGI